MGRLSSVPSKAGSTLHHFAVPSQSKPGQEPKNKREPKRSGLTGAPKLYHFSHLISAQHSRKQVRPGGAVARAIAVYGFSPNITCLITSHTRPLLSPSKGRQPGMTHIITVLVRAGMLRTPCSAARSRVLSKIAHELVHGFAKAVELSSEIAWNSLGLACSPVPAWIATE